MDNEKLELQREKLKWRKEMRQKFGPNWTKKKWSRTISASVK